MPARVFYASGEADPLKLLPGERRYCIGSEMPRTIKLRTVTTLDMVIAVDDSYATGPLSPQQRKELQKKIEHDTREKSAMSPGVSLVDVSIKRAFVVNG